MKTKEELNALIEEVDTLNKKLLELTEEELEKVTGGVKLSAGGGATLNNVDTLNRPPQPPSPIAESVKTAVDAALQTW